MDWAMFAAQWLHVLAGILWFGASLTTNFILVPAINRLSIPEQQRYRPCDALRRAPLQPCRAT